VSGGTAPRKEATETAGGGLVSTTRAASDEVALLGGSGLPVETVSTELLGGIARGASAVGLTDGLGVRNSASGSPVLQELGLVVITSRLGGRSPQFRVLDENHAELCKGQAKRASHAFVGIWLY
jgi:hypothetical protein